MSANEPKKLAIEGGTPAVQHPQPPMYPGGMRIDREEEEAVLEVLRSKRLFRWYGAAQGTSKVEELERAFAARVGTKHSVAVTSGTAALTCALAGIGVGPGDEVIVPGYTWIASATATITVGAVPIVAEVDESLTLDPADIVRRITPHTKAIMPVHMRGMPCRMDEIMAIARERGLKVVEDTAQADGGSYRGRRLGSIGDVGAFSLQYNKIITSGEGGVVVTNDEAIYKRALMYHDIIGSLRREVTPDELLPGTNYRMTELQGAVALVQLRKLDRLLEDMQRRKAMIKAEMADVARRKGVQFRTVNDPDGDCAICVVFYLPSVDKANKVAEALRAEGVGAGVMYSPDRPDYHVYRHWVPVVNKRTWTPDGGPWRWHEGDVDYSPGACPRTLDVLSRAVHLDVSPDLSEETIRETGEALNKVLGALA